jgi:hypothetical protein
MAMGGQRRSYFTGRELNQAYNPGIGENTTSYNVERTCAHINLPTHQRVKENESGKTLMSSTMHDVSVA